jgi:broad specificity phosphatase PhoE
MKLHILLSPLFFLLLATSQTQVQAATDADIRAEKLVILVRHAQKERAEGADPSLSATGQRQAEALEETLKRTPLSLLIASQFKRTIQTLSPIATAREMEINIVPADREIEAHLAAIVQRVKDTRGNVLIAGHSNTVPLIIQALGGPEIATIREEEYGGLYLLSLPEDRAPSLVISHYADEAGDAPGKDNSH